MTDSSQPTPSPEALDDLAGEYVLGTLDDEARRSLEQRLPREPVLRDAIARWESRLTPYTSMVDPVTPPPALWARIDRSVSERTLREGTDADSRVAERPQASNDDNATPWWSALWQNLPLWRGVSLASVVAALGLALAIPLQSDTGPRYLVVLSTPQHTQAGWMIQAASQRDIELIPLEDFQVPAGKTLQFWTKADDWSGPVSLGLVDASGPRRLTLDELPPLQENQLFELTLENDGGSPLDRPTGPIQFIGRAVSL
ncbi:anti-sigma factor [Salinicola aestuarinus]|uniref:anti-sigma factor n=1 Tax=Salinicola aestuarinus TaxID=1949082 RepID=UPI000DA21069|nr:anti-sigma factor [Salinicola aestuarinus]